MAPLIWTRRAIEDVQSIQQFIAQDSPHYAELVRQQLIAAVERLPIFPQSGRVVPEVDNPAIREVIHGSYRIVYRLIHGESIFSPFTTPPASSIWSRDFVNFVVVLQHSIQYTYPAPT